MNVLLINSYFDKNTSGCKPIPVSLGYLHASVRDLCEVEIFQVFKDEHEALIHKLITGKFDIIGLSAYDSIAHRVLETAKLIKRVSPDSYIVLGGPFATFAHEFILNNYKEIDFAVIGEGEKCLPELLNLIKNGKLCDIKQVPGLAYRIGKNIYYNEPVEINLDEIPLPSWDILLNEEILSADDGLSVLICPSRGCAGACTFCSMKSQHGNSVRFRSLDNIKAEINLLANIYNISSLYFMEADFFANKKRAAELLNMIKSLDKRIRFGITTRVDSFLKCADLLDGLFECGCRSVELGIESASDTQLARYRKKTTSAMNAQAVDIIESYKKIYHDLLIGYDFIPFDPYCTVSELKENIDFIFKANLLNISNESIFYNKINLFQGTKLRELALKDGLAFSAHENTYYDFAEEKTADIYKYIFAYEQCLQKKLDKITGLFSKINDSGLPASKSGTKENAKIYKAYLKRTKINFKYFKDIIYSEGNPDICSGIFEKYKNEIDAMYSYLSGLCN